MYENCSTIKDWMMFFYLQITEKFSMPYMNVFAAKHDAHQPHNQKQRLCEDSS